LCQKYLEKIDVRYKHMNLYGALRSGLMHSYSPWESVSGEKHRFWLTEGDSEHHLNKIANQDRTYVLNLQNFIVDIETVLEEFVLKVQLNQDKCRDNLIAWAKRKGWMNVSTISVHDQGGNLVTRSASGPEFFDRIAPSVCVPTQVTFSVEIKRAIKSERNKFG
jgi:hypothetical protein